MILLIYQRR